MDIELELQHLLQKRRCYLRVVEILHADQLVVSLECLFLADVYYLNMAFRKDTAKSVAGKNRNGKKLISLRKGWKLQIQSRKEVWAERFILKRVPPLNAEPFCCAWAVFLLEETEPGPRFQVCTKCASGPKQYIRINHCVWLDQARYSVKHNSWSAHSIDGKVQHRLLSSVVLVLLCQIICYSGCDCWYLKNFGLVFWQFVFWWD